MALVSGSVRIKPVAVQGGSTRMAAKSSPSHLYMEGARCMHLVHGRARRMHAHRAVGDGARSHTTRLDRPHPHAPPSDLAVATRTLSLTLAFALALALTPALVLILALAVTLTLALALALAALTAAPPLHRLARLGWWRPTPLRATCAVRRSSSGCARRPRAVSGAGDRAGREASTRSDACT